MKNIGKELARKLASVGAGTPQALREMGAKEAFARMRAAYPKVCLVHLYALEGAVEGVEYNALPQEVKADLKAFNDSFKEGRRA
ncbi:MAG: TfoX/Sxy family protein [Acutalibacter sp.]|nr:TfoX/Sxy family protein [Acutalibacter sp.]